MHRLRAALVLVLGMAMGCAGSQPASLQLPPGARIGILNVLEPQMTHVAVGTLRIDSFTNLYDVDWDIPGFMSRAVETDLRARGAYTFISLAPDRSGDWRRSPADGILRAVNAWMPADLRAYLERSAEEHRLDAVITVSSYSSGLWPDAACFKIGQSVVDTQGFGLFTRTRALSGLSGLLPFGQNQAYAYANILVAVFQARPARLAAFAAAPCSRPPLPDFPWGGDLQVLGPPVIQQVRPHVERLGSEAAGEALRKAGLSP